VGSRYEPCGGRNGESGKRRPSSTTSAAEAADELRRANSIVRLAGEQLWEIKWRTTFAVPIWRENANCKSKLTWKKVSAERLYKLFDAAADLMIESGG
jgi:hypothetical protein